MNLFNINAEALQSQAQPQQVIDKAIRAVDMAIEH